MGRWFCWVLNETSLFTGFCAIMIVLRKMFELGSISILSQNNCMQKARKRRYKH